MKFTIEKNSINKIHFIILLKELINSKINNKIS